MKDIDFAEKIANGMVKRTEAYLSEKGGRELSEDLKPTDMIALKRSLAFYLLVELTERGKNEKQ